MIHAREKLGYFLHELDVWSCSQNKTEFDWAESFPNIDELSDAACEVAICVPSDHLLQCDFDNIARVVSLSDESERAIEKIAKRSVSLQTLTRIAAAGDWKCRWQIYAYIDCSNVLAEQVVYHGVFDLHPYVARRAYLNLITSSSDLLAEASRQLSSHVDKALSDLAKEWVKSNIDSKRSGQQSFGENEG